MFFEGNRSERQLIETASLNLAHRWYLGYALDEDLPDHSSLTRIRQRLGIDIFQRFFEKIVDLCQEVRLVWRREPYFDATKVEANADLDSLVPRFYHAAKTHVAALFADDTPAAAAETEEAVENHRPAEVRQLPRAPSAAGPPAIDNPPWRLLEKRRLDPQRPSSGTYTRITDFRVSLTDPDATPMRTKQGMALGYHDHYVVDGGKRRIILAALVTPADVMENEPMLDLLWRVRFRSKLHPRQATGDTTYGTVENIVAVEDASIRAYLPLMDFDHRSSFYGRDAFTYDADQDRYRCPEQHPLERERVKATEGIVVYRADPVTCNACPVKVKCTESRRGRIVHRSLYAEHLERVRSYHATEPYKKAIRKRPGLGRAALRRGQGVARVTPLSAARAQQRQYRGLTDCGGAEPEAILGRDRVGAAPRAVREPSGRPKRARTAPDPLRVILIGSETGAPGHR